MPGCEVVVAEMTHKASAHFRSHRTRKPGKQMVLDVVVGNGALSGFGVAINLPVNGSVAFTPGTGLTPNRAVLDPGNAPAAAGGALNKSGPLPNVLTLGVARKKSSASDGDLTFAAGATLFTTSTGNSIARAFACCDPHVSSI